MTLRPVAMLAKVTVPGLATRYRMQLSSGLIEDQPDRNPITSVTYRWLTVQCSAWLQAIVWDVITWAVIRWDPVPAVPVTGASTDSQASVQLHGSVSGFDNTLSHVQIAQTYPGSGGGWCRNQAGWIPVHQGKEFSVFLSCSAESNLLQNSGTADWTGMQNQVWTELCVCTAAVFVHALKEGTCELK